MYGQAWPHNSFLGDDVVLPGEKKKVYVVLCYLEGAGEPQGANGQGEGVNESTMESLQTGNSPVSAQACSLLGTMS